LQGADEVLGILALKPLLRTVMLDASELVGWDSNLLTFLIKIKNSLEKRGIDCRADALPEGARRLLKLAAAVPEHRETKNTVRSEPFLSRIGGRMISLAGSAEEVFAFLGDAVMALVALFKGKASFRRSDVFLFLQESGVQALPIVSLISLLFGLILAFVGAIQLQTFGAQIYVADLVGIAVVRVMGAVMTGIIMAGRTGASYAAQLGTMQVNEEIDALKTLGISPMEFLVLPRMLSLTLMMPLLCVYADIMGILGGLIVGIGMLDLSLTAYLAETKNTLSLTNLWIGLFHSMVFGVIISLIGCLRGLQCGRSASAVGFATTSAVVTAIVFNVVATAIITVACNLLRI
jgi:phospholipid/cholesterol/gamma-HCH transport system permease protein